MAIRDVITRGLGSWGQGTRYLLSAGLLAAAPPAPLGVAQGGAGGRMEGQVSIFNYDTWARIMDALDTATWVDDAEVHLFQNNIVPDADTVLADLEEAVFSGYAEQPLAVTATVFRDLAGNFVAQYPSVPFQVTSPVTDTTVVYGYWIEGTAGGTGIRLLWCERFLSGVPMNTIDDAIIVDPQFMIANPV